MLNLIATLAVGTVISFIVFKLAVALYKKVRSPLLNPLLVTVAVIIALLCVFHIPLDSYESSVQLVSFLLGPATVALAYSVYRQRQILKQHFIPIFCGCLVGSVVSMISAYTLCELLGLGDEMATSFIPQIRDHPHRHRRVGAAGRHHVHHRGGRHHHRHPRRHLRAAHVEDLLREQPHRQGRGHRHLQPRGGHHESP